MRVISKNFKNSLKVAFKNSFNKVAHTVAAVLSGFGKIFITLVKSSCIVTMYLFCCLVSLSGPTMSIAIQSKRKRDCRPLSHCYLVPET